MADATMLALTAVTTVAATALVARRWYGRTTGTDSANGDDGDDTGHAEQPARPTRMTRARAAAAAAAEAAARSGSATVPLFWWLSPGRGLAPARRKTLVLDLDETLIHSHSNAAVRPALYDTKIEVMIESSPCMFYVSRRPHADYFLKQVRIPSTLRRWSHRGLTARSRARGVG